MQVPNKELREPQPEPVYPRYQFMAGRQSVITASDPCTLYTLFFTLV